jgi:hypothetical protein
MRIKCFLIIVLGTLACMLLLDELAPQPLVGRDSNLVYALGTHHGRQQENGAGSPNSDSAPPTHVSEPAILLLLGAGLVVLAGYARRKFLKKQINI